MRSSYSSFLERRAAQRPSERVCDPPLFKFTRVGVGVFFVLLSLIDFPHATVQSGVAVDSDELRCPLFAHAVAPLVDDKPI